MKLPGFIGPTYAGLSSIATGERCQNWFPESAKSSAPENSYTLIPTPGCNLFSAALATLGPIQGLYTDPATGRVFAVVGNKFYELYSNGQSVTHGTVGSGPYTFASNSAQVMISCSDSTGYIFTLTTGALAQITAPGFLATSQCCMIDNYFLSLVPHSRTFQMSSLLDGTQWDALDFALAEGGSDNLVGMLADHRELWLFGSQHAEVFQDTGAANFPFERINSIYFQQGLAAAKSLVRGGNTIYWLGQNEQGAYRFYRNDNYTPIAVSTRSVEYFFSQYAKNGGVTDAVAYSYQDESGHTFIVLSFPSATCEPSATGGVTAGVIQGATWVYDETENMWHERPHRNPATGQLGAHLGRYHTFAFGKHLVAGGDTSGNIYEMTENAYTDNGAPIRRMRRAPHVQDELKMIFYAKFRLSCEVGTGPSGDPLNAVTLRCSNNGGNTWSNEYTKSLGDAGNFDKIVEWRRLGRAMRRAFEVVTMVKGPITLIDAFIDGEEESTDGQ